MAFPQCSCSPQCVSPASCPCVFRGVVAPLAVSCSRCGFVACALWPRGWRALVLRCPHCAWGSQVSFAGLPSLVQGGLQSGWSGGPGPEGPEAGTVADGVKRLQAEWVELRETRWTEEISKKNLCN